MQCRKTNSVQYSDLPILDCNTFPLCWAAEWLPFAGVCVDRAAGAKGKGVSHKQFSSLNICRPPWAQGSISWPPDCKTAIAALKRKTIWLLGKHGLTHPLTPTHPAFPIGRNRQHLDSAVLSLSIRKLKKSVSSRDENCETKDHKFLHDLLLGSLKRHVERSLGYKGTNRTATNLSAKRDKPCLC